MSEEDRQARDTSAWMAVLDRLIGDLGRSLEQMPATPAPLPVTGTDYPPLQVIDLRLGQMQAGLERAEQDAAEAERQLAAVLDPLEEWLKKLRASRDNLTVRVS